MTAGMKPPYVLIKRLLNGSDLNLLCKNPAEFDALQVCGLRASHRCLLHI